MALIKDIKVSWVKLNQDRPDMGFDGDSPTWQVTGEVSKKVFDKWRKDKLGGAKQHEDGTYTIVFKRKAQLFDDGSPKKAPKCVSANLEPLASETVGNGSVGNIQFSIYDWEFKGKKGKAADLQALQVTTHVVRAEEGQLEFEVEGDDVEDMSELSNEGTQSDDEFDLSEDDDDDKVY